MNSRTINRTTPFGLWQYAKDYLEGFKIIWEKQPELTGPYQVKFYLLCHSLELGFKAYLRSQGCTLKTLMKLRHDINKIVAECFKKGLEKYFVFQNDELNCLRLANSYYLRKEFEYIKIGSKTLPNLEIPYEIAKRLLENIRDLCAPKKK